MSLNEVSDYQRFEKNVSKKKDTYLLANPYGFAIFGDFFEEDFLCSLNQEIYCRGFALDVRAIPDEEVKFRSKFRDDAFLPTHLKQLFDVLKRNTIRCLWRN